MKHKFTKRDQKKGVVLLSGGLDSATTLFWAKSKGFDCRCLICDYGQRHRHEVQAAKSIARFLGLSYTVIKLNFPWKGSSLLDKKVKIPKGVRMSDGIPSTYVPGRNIVFLSLATSFAEVIGAEAIFIGAHIQDYSGYPDCRPDFYQAFQQAIDAGTKSGVEKRSIKIRTPLLEMRKSEIVRLAVRLKVPLKLTWSCYNGAKFPCGDCDSCYFRKKGFQEAGVKDPALKIC